MISKVIKDLSVPSLPLMVLRWNDITHSLTNGIRAKVMGLSHGSVIVREGLLGGSQFDSLQPL